MIISAVAHTPIYHATGMGNFEAECYTSMHIHPHMCVYTCVHTHTPSGFSWNGKKNDHNHLQRSIYCHLGPVLEALESQGKASKAETIAQQTAQVAEGRQTVVVEEFLAESAVLGVLLPQLAVGVGALVSAGHL